MINSQERKNKLRIILINKSAREKKRWFERYRGCAFPLVYRSKENNKTPSKQTRKCNSTYIEQKHRGRTLRDDIRIQRNKSLSQLPTSTIISEIIAIKEDVGRELEHNKLEYNKLEHNKLDYSKLEYNKLAEECNKYKYIKRESRAKQLSYRSTKSSSNFNMHMNREYGERECIYSSTESKKTDSPDIVDSHTLDLEWSKEVPTEESESIMTQDNIYNIWDTCKQPSDPPSYAQKYNENNPKIMIVADSELNNSVIQRRARSMDLGSCAPFSLSHVPHTLYKNIYAQTNANNLGHASNSSPKGCLQTTSMPFTQLNPPLIHALDKENIYDPNLIHSNSVYQTLKQREERRNYKRNQLRAPFTSISNYPNTSYNNQGLNILYMGKEQPSNLHKDIMRTGCFPGISAINLDNNEAIGDSIYIDRSISTQSKILEPKRTNSGNNNTMGRSRSNSVFCPGSIIKNKVSVTEAEVIPDISEITFDKSVLNHSGDNSEDYNILNILDLNKDKISLQERIGILTKEMEILKSQLLNEKTKQNKLLQMKKQLQKETIQE